jgi:hypothetical protein
MLLTTHEVGERLHELLRPVDDVKAHVVMKNNFPFFFFPLFPVFALARLIKNEVTMCVHVCL